MSTTKPITISFQLVPGRDDRAIEFLAPDHINSSAAIRAGLELYIDKVEGQPDFETEVLARLDKLANRGAIPQPEKQKQANPFLAASP